MGAANLFAEIFLQMAQTFLVPLTASMAQSTDSAERDVANFDGFRLHYNNVGKCILKAILSKWIICVLR